MNCRELKYLNLTEFVHALIRDPDLAGINPYILPHVLQMLFITSGCDYISFFSNIGKASFLRYFFQYASFITSNKPETPGTLADTSLKEKTYEIGFLAFIRLIGTIYFKKHATGFETSSPEACFHKFITHSQTIKEQHLNWLKDIKQNIWDRIQFENEMIPSSDALYLHWKISCWISHMWQQADKNTMVLEDITNYGWRLDDGNLKVFWDTDENMQSIRKMVEILLQGCKCKTGCTTARCSCKKIKEICREGYQCINCENTEDLPNESNIPETQYTEWEELFDNGLDDEDFDELADMILNDDDIYQDNENLTDDESLD